MNECPQHGFAPEPDDDRKLIEQVLSGRPELFHDLVRRHEAAIYRGALAILGNAADAEDAMQETFLRAFRHLGQFRGDAKFRTWLIQIAVNVARSRLQLASRQRWETLETVDADGRQESPSQATPEEQYLWKELRERFSRVLEGMHPAYRSVLCLRDLENLSTEATAAALGLTPENVRTRLRRARALLRIRMERHWQRPAENSE